MGSGSELHVRPVRNGNYWQARWYDSDGNVVSRGLGRCDKLSRRQVNAKCRQIEAELRDKPGLRDRQRAPTLGWWLKHDASTRQPKVSKATMQLDAMTARYLLAHFGPDRDLDRIEPVEAAAWRARLAKGELEAARNKASKVVHWAPEVSQSTVAAHVRRAKAIFARACIAYKKIGLENPFNEESGTARAPDRDWQHVSFADLKALLAFCPDEHWQAFLSLLRVQGLRVGEALALRPADLSHVGEPATLDFGVVSLPIYGQMTIKALKRNAAPVRVMPIIRPEVAKLLVKLMRDCHPNDPLLRIRRNNMRRRMLGLIEDAGLKPWADIFQVLRRNCETDLSNFGIPQYAVSQWIGHDIKISQEYYLADANAHVGGGVAAGSILADVPRHRNALQSGTNGGTKNEDQNQPQPQATK